MNFRPALSLALLTGLIFSGCNTAGTGQLSRVQTGMTREQVTAIMGAPDHTVIAGNQENLIYYLYADVGIAKHAYVIQLVEGQVHYVAEMQTMIVRPAATP
ncbi:MAG TPA: outer membrane protein assembly factor BamE [Opitutaceae bacterium]|jgi:outer membrane protein assembly factor BamE (lipoprotein component of BamABCDE complex)|nr:outer membrane protein assembly factor BamE [Opitutaceae bacterium]